MQKIFKIPKVQLILSLLLIYLTAFVNFPNFNTLYLLFFCVGFCVFFDLLFTYFRRRVLFIPYAAIATGLIMSLIINQSAGILQIAVSATVAIGIKNFVRISGRHIFNPVATGLFLSGLFFGDYIGWWGVSFQNIRDFHPVNLIFFLILSSPFLVSGLRLKKYYAILTYLCVNTIFTHFSTPSLHSFISALLNPSILFFAIVMLPEPMTSPVRIRNQVIYGAVVASIPFIFAITSLSEIFAKSSIAFDPLLFALLLGNLIFFKNR